MRRPAPDDSLDDDEWFAVNRGHLWRLRPCRPGEADDGWWALVPFLRDLPGGAGPPRHLSPACWRGNGDELLRAWFGWVLSDPLPPREPAPWGEASPAREGTAAS
jgi:hypothetical protein